MHSKARLATAPGPFARALVHAIIILITYRVACLIASRFMGGADALKMFSGPTPSFSLSSDMTAPPIASLFDASGDGSNDDDVDVVTVSAGPLDLGFAKLPRPLTEREALNIVVADLRAAAARSEKKHTKFAIAQVCAHMLCC
jgi:hypothetical protein